jgi:hypothetical protein
VENLKVKKLENEVVVFLLFFYLWANFIIYKSAFLKHGFSIIWGNIPRITLQEYFAGIDPVRAMASIGLFPLIFGSYIVYKYLMRKKSKSVMVFISISLLTTALLLLQLIQVKLALVFIGSTLAVLFGRFLQDLQVDLRKTKLSRFLNYFYVLVIMLFSLTQIIPGVFTMIETVNEAPSENYIEVFKWLNTTQKGATIMALPQEGHLITYFGKRKNVMDTQYLLIEDADQRLKDISSIYTTKFRIEVIRTLTKYNADYLLLTDKARSKYKIRELTHLDTPCFNSRDIGNATIYRWNKNFCNLENEN